MTSKKHKILFAFLLLQTLGAIALIASFYIELWALELLVSFTPFATILLLLSLVPSTILVIILKSYKQNIPLLALAGITWIAGIYILFYSLHIQRPIELTSSASATITFAAFNKHYINNQEDRFVDYFKQQDVDIISLQEVQPEAVARIAEKLGFEHSYSTRTFATSGGTAVALLSRYPFESVSTVELETKHPIARAVVQTPENGTIAVYAVHIPVPSSNFLYNKRNIVMKSLAEELQEETLPVIVGGDFNTTVFSPALRTFNSAVNAALQPVALEKWPTCSWYGYGSPLCVRIDHVFVSKNAHVTNFTVAPDLGSDHRALITKITLTRS